MKRILSLAIFFAVISCEPRQDKNVDQAPMAGSDVHAIVVQEVLQAPSYTYIRCTENDQEIWIAVAKGDVEVGKTYYYLKSMEMTNFKSKELDRTFESIYFLDNLTNNPDELKQPAQSAMGNAPKTKTPMARQKNLTIEPEAGVTSIADIYANKAALGNKTVKVKGLVTKFNPGIMEKNWVHIQDGTGDDTSFDLTITTEAMVNEGQVVVFEGTLALDKDFGHGYKYALIVEGAVLQGGKPAMTVN